MPRGEHHSSKTHCVNGHEFTEATMLTLIHEEAMSLDETLEPGNRTCRVQVAAIFRDQSGVEYGATRIVKMKLKRVEMPREV